MAASVLMASSDRQSADASLPLPLDRDHHPLRRSSGRRKSKGCDSSAGQKKKQPQRGMGVEKLERLRLQERWKKMTEINATNQGIGIPANRFSDPTLINASVPLHLPKMGGFGVQSISQMGLSQSQSQNHICMGFHGHMDVWGSASDQLQKDPSGVGCLNSLDLLGKNVSGISKELSPAPNVVKCFVKHCNTCHKKKKVDGENLGAGRVRTDVYAQKCNVGDWGLLGLNTGDNENIINQENQGLGTKGPLAPQGGLATGNGKQVVEVVAVHRKGSSGSEGGSSVLIEYEFFPSGKGCCRSNNSLNDELVMMKEASSASSSSSSSRDMSGILNASNCIDLSLKLSY